MDSGLDEMRKIIREKDPIRPSTRISALDQDSSTTIARCRSISPPAMTRLIRGDLDWITMKAMEKDRTRRYQSVGDLRQAIDKLVGTLLDHANT